ncbi:glycosyltransferase family 2 protein [Nucisporomicrobium flavum]|jgi:cellulose synthase/poly-beta-1,6-N-acetylglucosamine synthase-like glycosyltransferase|uniref:glycosyltransferase family 2 protein n=1 Tax=Nucisporomicrobium flavum TaxID=2785915 RepID=UPI0018F59D2A|nr:glycosyltransferase family 2 protein [Nucisporomicrobium flavum]
MIGSHPAEAPPRHAVPRPRTASHATGEGTRRFRPQRRLQVVAIVPAYNEADAIADTIASLRRQTQPPDQIVVVPNNCTDDTADVAAAHGAYVIPYPGHNPDKKAGAINYALDRLEPYLDDPWDWAILVMDADTTLSPEFVSIAARHLTAGVGGVGGTFTGRECHTVLGYLQRMEYHRYGQVAKRMGGRAHVLTGTGTLFSYGALLDVRQQRRAGTLLPEGQQFYDTHSLTEDNELTLALQACGYQVLSPQGMTATTDVMETVPKLIGQRERWYLGAMRNIVQYGRLMPFHMRWTYWRQQVGLLLSAIVAAVYLIALAVSLIVFGDVDFRWYWALPSVILLAERVWSVWAMGWRARLYAATFVPEQLYTLLLTYIYAKALAAFVRGDKGGWAAT